MALPDLVLVHGGEHVHNRDKDVIKNNFRFGKTGARLMAVRVMV